MRSLLKQLLVFVCSGIMVGGPMARRADGEPGLAVGKPTAGEAASARDGAHATVNLRHSGWQSALADTTEYEFPEEDEQRNVVKDVIIFGAVAAFVAFFIIKVFLQGDTEDTTPSGDNGKGINPPPTTVSVQTPAYLRE